MIKFVSRINFVASIKALIGKVDTKPWFNIDALKTIQIQRNKQIFFEDNSLINDTRCGKLCFTQFSTRMAA